MATQLTADDARQSLTAHVEAKGVEVFLKYGGRFDEPTLQRLLSDRAFVRYPCEIAFEASKLMLGELAHPEQKGAAPEDGFTMYVNPALASRFADVAAAVLYQLVVINYGEFASLDEAETFGAAALGLTRDEYYERLCGLADELGHAPAAPPDDGSCHGGCTCH